MGTTPAGAPQAPHRVAERPAPRRKELPPDGPLSGHPLWLRPSGKSVVQAHLFYDANRGVYRGVAGDSELSADQEDLVDGASRGVSPSNGAASLRTPQ